MENSFFEDKQLFYETCHFSMKSSVFQRKCVFIRKFIFQREKQFSIEDLRFFVEQFISYWRKPFSGKNVVLDRKKTYWSLPLYSAEGAAFRRYEDLHSNVFKHRNVIKYSTIEYIEHIQGHFRIGPQGLHSGSISKME